MGVLKIFLFFPSNYLMKVIALPSTKGSIMKFVSACKKHAKETIIWEQISYTNRVRVVYVFKEKQKNLKKIS